MEYKIHGTVMQALEVTLARGESIYTESGGMAWMTDGIDMKTSGKGGLGSMIGRKLAGESMFMTTYTCQVDQGMITFTPESPGKVIPLALKPGYSMICQKDAFMCAEETVQLEMHFRRKLGSGLFGGEGFILQKLTGPGTAFVEIAGEVQMVELKAGERLKIDPGHIAMYEPTCSYDVEMVKGVMNMFMGGEGLFLATVTGPGRVWLQTMPLSNLAGSLKRYIATSS
ncbi:MAG TPA: TIGR00266 family protein [Aggregatilinea sp.]|uniref:TIGR00266 family protein n=1 Tax=Aggregatilinea sp. TaxID=2806333 RepID=UPI002C3C2F65|nr:TIGR00266 family protein [Aggregatilinea sp.]HML23898.1 TIGR00266 family protein [Aggregatilinea sp.]